MRARLLLAAPVSLVIALGSLSLVATPASAKPKRPKPTIAIALGAAEYDEGVTPTLTYSWTGLRKRDRLKLERKTETGSWRFERTLPKVTSRDGSATVVADPVDLGLVSYRLTASYKKSKRAFARKKVMAETGAARVYGAVPIEDIIRTYSASNAQVRRGTTTIGGQPFAYTFARYLTGENTWRTIVSLAATSCKGWGIPLGSRRHGSSTGGTFGMQALGAGGTVLAQNAAAPDVGAGLLFPTTVGSSVAIQVRSDVFVDYYGRGQAICWTDDGTQ